MLHRVIIDNEDNIYEELYRWIWNTLKTRYVSCPMDTPYVSGEEILQSAKYSILNRKLQKKFKQAWQAMMDNGELYHDTSLHTNLHWIGRPKFKKWRLTGFDKKVDGLIVIDKSLSNPLNNSQ